MRSGDFNIDHAVGLDKLLQLDHAQLAELMIPLHRIRRPGQSCEPDGNRR
jgi:hypothetical protein